MARSPKDFQPADVNDPNASDRREGCEPSPVVGEETRQTVGIKQSWMDWVCILVALMALLAMMVLSGCSSTRQTDTTKQESATYRFNALLPVTTPTGVEMVPLDATLTVDASSDEQQDEKKRATVDAEAIAAAVAKGVAAAAKAASGPSGAMSAGMDLWEALGGTGLLATATGAGIVALKTRRKAAVLDTALKDAVDYAKDAGAAMTPDELEAVKDRHRIRQLQRGTNAVIKERL